MGSIFVAWRVGNVAGDECDGHQERRHKNQSQQVVRLHAVEELAHQRRGGERTGDTDHYCYQRKHHCLPQD